MQTNQILNRLIADNKISVRCDSRREHDNLRIRLLRMYRNFQATAADLGYSDTSSSLAIHSSYNESSRTSTFHLKERKERQTDYELISI